MASILRRATRLTPLFHSQRSWKPARVCIPRAFNPAVRSYASETTPSGTPSQTQSLQTALESSSLFQKISGSPEARQAMLELVETLKSKGVDVTSTQPPSTVTMMKLLASSDFRTTLSKVMEQLKKAGVDLSSKDALDEIMKIRKGSGF